MDDLLPTTWLAYKQITQIRDPLPQTGYTERFKKGKKPHGEYVLTATIGSSQKYSVRFFDGMLLAQ